MPLSYATSVLRLYRKKQDARPSNTHALPADEVWPGDHQADSASRRHEHHVGVAWAHVPGMGPRTKTSTHREADGSRDGSPTDSNRANHEAEAQDGQCQPQRLLSRSEAEEAVDSAPQAEPGQRCIERTHPAQAGHPANDRLRHCSRYGPHPWVAAEPFGLEHLDQPRVADGHV